MPRIRIPRAAPAVASNCAFTAGAAILFDCR